MPSQVEVLRAVWTLTRHAKRYRDKAQDHYQNGNHKYAGWNRIEKEKAYQLKGQAIAHLIKEGELQVSGYHKFGDLYAEICSGSGFTFHRPCPVPADVNEVADLGESLEAKPKTSKELGIQLAKKIITTYLTNKEQIEVFQWSKVYKNRQKYCYNCGRPDHLAYECADDDDDDFREYDEFEEREELNEP